MLKTIRMMALTTFCLLLYPMLIAGTLNQQSINEIAKLDDQNHYYNALQKILIPRVVGSEGWRKVQSFIYNEMKSMGLQVELDSFEDNVPIFGRLNFVNVIGRLNPDADTFLVLSAHYDSKYFPNAEFLGATDSAVPCAILLNLLKTTLPTLKSILEGKNIGLMIIFFDGEEAFQEWSDKDSIYGSRHLAQKWASQKYKNVKEIDRIDVLVLLDLIGYGTPRFVCTFKNTCGLNQRLSAIETSLQQSKNLSGNSKIFLNKFKYSGVDDDHKPFLQRGVPILHLIPTTFPRVWHTPYDNAEQLDQNAILNFNRIMRVFIIDYFTDCTSSQPSRNCRLK